jgi:hypothetical protein
VIVGRGVSVGGDSVKVGELLGEVGETVLVFCEDVGVGVIGDTDAVFLLAISVTITINATINITKMIILFLLIPDVIKRR